MPGQGVTSMFNFGQSFGILKGICCNAVTIIFCKTSKVENIIILSILKKMQVGQGPLKYFHIFPHNYLKKIQIGQMPF